MWLDLCGHACTIVGVYGRTYLVMLAGNVGLRDRGRTDLCGHDCVAVPVCVTVGLCGHACVALFGLCGRACVEVSVYVTVGLRGRTWVVWAVCPFLPFVWLGKDQCLPLVWPGLWSNLRGCTSIR